MLFALVTLIVAEERAEKEGLRVVVKCVYKREEEPERQAESETNRKKEGQDRKTDRQK